MKRTLVILTLAIAAAVTLNSCAAQKDGCKASRGYIGYGSSR